MKPDLEKLRSDKPIEIFNVVNTSIKKDKLLEICEGIFTDKIYISQRYPFIPIAKNKMDDIWLQDPLQDRSWRFWLHTLSMIEYLLAGADIFNRKDYIKKSTEILISWIKESFPDSKSEMAWNDHSTALRLIIICRWFEKWKSEYWDENLADLILEVVYEHCVKLADPLFYKEKHNHGMDQDIALYISTFVFDQFGETIEWRALAKRRFWVQFNHLIALDGSYLEHSPGYSLLFLGRFLDFMKFLEYRNDPDYIKLEFRINTLIEFLTYTLQPDGQMPPIGDSDMGPVEVVKLNKPRLDMLGKLLYASTCGKEGKAPGQVEKVFLDGGYGILRNRWAFDESTVQMLFYCSFHSRVHKHSDDLSLTLFAHGRPLLVDGGKFNYNYESEGRKYIISSNAHNSVIVDDSSTEVVRLNIGKSGITGCYLDDKFSILAGAHCLYRRIVHRRVILYLKPWNFIVVDYLKGSREHNFKQIFNFNPSLDCKFEHDSTFAYSGGQQFLSITQLYERSSIKSLLVKGQTTPLQGFCGWDYGVLTPCWSLVNELIGKEAKYAAHIKLNSNILSNISLEWRDQAIEVNWDGLLMHLFIDKDGVFFSSDKEVIDLNKYCSPVLKEAIKLVK